MTRYFMRDTPLCQLEQQMMTPPNFKPRGHGLHCPGFRYRPKDVDCQYGYLKKPVKEIVDAIVDELAKLPEVAECYEVWNQIREELNECYGHSTPWERLPLSNRKEFRKIKNDIIREAENIRLGLPTFEDEQMRDEPEPEEKNEHHSYSVYEQAQRYTVS